MKKIISLVLIAAILLGSVGASAAAAGQITYTLNLSASSLELDWNPHSWSTEEDKTVFELLTTPLVAMTILDSEEHVYQWAYKAATAVSAGQLAEQQRGCLFPGRSAACSA